MCWGPQTLRCLKSPTWKTDQGVFCQSILIFCGKPAALGPGEALRNRPVLWTVHLDSRYEVLCNNFKTWSNHWRFGSNYKGMTVWSTKIVSLRGLHVLAVFSRNDTTQWQSTWQSFRPWWHRWRGCRGWGRAGQGWNWQGLGMLQLKPIFLNAWTRSENRKTSTWGHHDVCLWFQMVTTHVYSVLVSLLLHQLCALELWGAGFAHRGHSSSSTTGGAAAKGHWDETFCSRKKPLCF